MKQLKRKALLLLMMLVMCMLLTGCYKEVDPWPASAPVATELPPTAVPTAVVPMVPTAEPVRATLAPLPPPVTITEEPDEEDFWADEHSTPMPGGEVDPGFNG